MPLIAIFDVGKIAEAWYFVRSFDQRVWALQGLASGIGGAMPVTFPVAVHVRPFRS
jgi:hypothetical protein